MKSQTRIAVGILAMILTACGAAHNSSSMMSKPITVRQTVLLPPAAISSPTDLVGTWKSGCYSVDPQAPAWALSTLVITDSAITTTVDRYLDASCTQIYFTAVYQSNFSISRSGAFLNQVYPQMSVLMRSDAAAATFPAHGGYCKKQNWFLNAGMPSVFTDVTVCGEPATTISPVSLFKSASSSVLLIHYPNYADDVKYTQVSAAFTDH